LHTLFCNPGGGRRAAESRHDWREEIPAGFDFGGTVSGTASLHKKPPTRMPAVLVSI
jgi:hypothetical protein